MAEPKLGTYYFIVTVCNQDRCSDSQNLLVSVECGPLSSKFFLN